ncbi:MAG TPA: hypothetical protein VGP89_19130 [Candidatus Angelobacter sp.]|jgi:hypothetical protein|nr:hypothetical protein [Candidatus Angelobacter sp.]
MTGTARFQVSIWANDNPEPDKESVVFADEWGSAAAEIELIRSELIDLQADGMINKFAITELDCNDLQLHELRKWIANYKEE